MKYTYHTENTRSAVRKTVLASMLLVGAAVFIYAPLSTARDDSSMSGQSGQGSSMSTQTSSGQTGASSGHHKGHHKKHGSSAQSQSGSSASSPVPEEQRTGVTGDTPSGGHSETSGQKRGPSGY